MRSLIFAAVLGVATLTGCASDRDNRILTGAVVGGVLGDAIGGSAGAIGGAVVGGAVGAHTSDRRDDRRYDRDRHNRNEYQRCRNAGYSHGQCRR